MIEIEVGWLVDDVLGQGTLNEGYLEDVDLERVIEIGLGYHGSVDWGQGISIEVVNLEDGQTLNLMDDHYTNHLHIEIDEM